MRGGGSLCFENMHSSIIAFRFIFDCEGPMEKNRAFSPIGKVS